jgi:hypothetical protein
MANKITKITRYAILEVLNTYMATDFYGRLNEVEFWERIFNLEKLPSTDSRYPDMKGDLWQHRVNNNDWDDNWYIDKFDLLETEDAKFLKFLAEFFHPEVRDINWNTKRVLATINKNLALDGVELYAKSKVSGRDILGARNITPATQIDETPLAIIDNDFISLQINKKCLRPHQTVLNQRGLLPRGGRSIQIGTQQTARDNWQRKSHRSVQYECREQKILHATVWQIGRHNPCRKRLLPRCWLPEPDHTILTQ